MAWHRPCDKPLSEPMMFSLLTHICVTRPQWVKVGRGLFVFCTWVSCCAQCGSLFPGELPKCFIFHALWSSYTIKHQRMAQVETWLQFSILYCISIDGASINLTCGLSSYKYSDGSNMLRHAGCSTSRLIAFYHVHGALLQRRHNERDGVSNHRRLDYFVSRFYRSSSKKTSKLRVTGLCEGNSPVTDEFPEQKASNTENVSIWWRHHITRVLLIWWYNFARHPMMKLVTTFQHHGKYDSTIFLSSSNTHFKNEIGCPNQRYQLCTLW